MIFPIYFIELIRPWLILGLLGQPASPPFPISCLSLHQKDQGMIPSQWNVKRQRGRHVGHDNWLLYLIESAWTNGSMIVLCSIYIHEVYSESSGELLLKQLATFWNKFLFSYLTMLMLVQRIEVSIDFVIRMLSCEISLCQVVISCLSVSRSCSMFYVTSNDYVWIRLSGPTTSNWNVWFPGQNQHDQMKMIGFDLMDLPITFRFINTF